MNNQQAFENMNRLLKEYKIPLHLFPDEAYKLAEMPIAANEALERTLNRFKGEQVHLKGFVRYWLKVAGNIVASKLRRS